MALDIASSSHSSLLLQPLTTSLQSISPRPIHTHTAVRASLLLDNPSSIADPVFGLLGNAAASQGLGQILDPDCLQQATADQAFTNAKAAGDVQGMTDALVFRTLERNTGAVGQKSVLCMSVQAVKWVVLWVRLTCVISLGADQCSAYLFSASFSFSLLSSQHVSMGPICSLILYSALYLPLLADSFRTPNLHHSRILSSSIPAVLRLPLSRSKRFFLPSRAFISTSLTSLSASPYTQAPRSRLH